MLGITDLKSGVKCVLDGQPYLVAWNQFSKTGRQGGVMKTKLKNLITGNVMDKTFQGNDKLEPADITFRKAQFLYAAGDQYDFMDQESFETISLSKDVLGDAINFLNDGIEIDLQCFNGDPINIQLPIKMTFEVIEAEPAVKGNTAGNLLKNATIETGYELKVPPFIAKGEKIVVNTDTKEYIERAK